MFSNLCNFMFIICNKLLFLKMSTQGTMFRPNPRKFKCEECQNSMHHQLVKKKIIE